MFHRLVAPTYTGGLPAGYDLINPGGAAADSKKLVGVSSPTYFIGFGEDASSSAANRASKALAENTDLLDDYLHRDIALPQVTAVLTNATGAALSSLAFGSSGLFVGAAGTPNTAAGIETFLVVVDTDDGDIVTSAGDRTRVTAISGATVGSGFAPGAVTLTFSPSIPTGASYRIYYAQRFNLATAPLDGFTLARRRHDSVKFPGGAPWAGGSSPGWSPMTLQNAVSKIVTDLSAHTATANDGASRLGAAAVGALVSGTIRDQLTALESGWGKLARANTWTGNQVFDNSAIMNFSLLVGDGVAPAYVTLSSNTTTTVQTGATINMEAGGSIHGVGGVGGSWIDLDGQFRGDTLFKGTKTIDATAHVNFDPEAGLLLPNFGFTKFPSQTFIRALGPPIHMSNFDWLESANGMYRLHQTSPSIGRGYVAYRIHLPLGAILSGVYIYIQGNSGHSSLAAPLLKPRAQVLYGSLSEDAATPGNLVTDGTTVPATYETAHPLGVTGTDLPVGSTDPFDPTDHYYDFYFFGETGPGSIARLRILGAIAIFTTDKLDFAPTG